MKSLKINENLQKFLRPLEAPELKELEQGILSAGKILQKIIVWKGQDVIVDGHHRYQIACKYKLPFETEEMEFENEMEAMKWIYKNQAGRRNMDHESLSEVRAMITQMFATGKTVSAVSKELNISKQNASREKKRFDVGSVIGDHDAVKDLPQRDVAVIVELPTSKQMEVVQKLRDQPDVYKTATQVLMESSNTDKDAWNSKMMELKGVVTSKFYGHSFPDCEYLDRDVRNNLVSAAEMLMACLEDCVIVPCPRCPKVKGECKACGGRKFVCKSVSRMYGA